MKNSRAFTLIELLVVVLIIGILAAVAVPQYQKAVLKSRMMKLYVRADAIYKSAQVYHLSNGVYPTDMSELDIDITDGGTLQKTNITNSDHKGVVWDDGDYCAIVFQDQGIIWCFLADNFGWNIESVTGKTYCRGYSENAKSICRSLAVGEPKESGSFLDYPIN